MDKSRSSRRNTIQSAFGTNAIPTVANVLELKKIFETNLKNE